MCARRHADCVPTGRTEQLAGDRRAVNDAIAIVLVLLATAAILVLAGLAMVGVLNVIAWLAGR